jgi:uncharacterized metal-binding protein
MPSGRTHLRIEAALLFGWTALAGYLLSVRAVRVESVVAFVLAYAFSMLYLSPDLDLARSRASRRWGVGRWLWVPYALIFKHRGLSHHPLLGPLTRVLYLAAIVAMALLLLFSAAGRPIGIARPSSSIVLGALLGLYVPNVTHITADRLVSRWRGRRPRRRL